MTYYCVICGKEYKMTTGGPFDGICQVCRFHAGQEYHNYVCPCCGANYQKVPFGTRILVADGGRK